jgi:hypothetical protein
MKNKSDYIFKARSSILINYKSIIFLIFLLVFSVRSEDSFFSLFTVIFLAFRVISPFFNNLYFYDDKIVFKRGIFILKETIYELTEISSVDLKSKSFFNNLFNFGDIKFVRKFESYNFYFISDPKFVKENFEKYYSLVK